MKDRVIKSLKDAFIISLIILCGIVVFGLISIGVTFILTFIFDKGIACILGCAITTFIAIFSVDLLMDILDEREN